MTSKQPQPAPSSRKPAPPPPPPHAELEHIASRLSEMGTAELVAIVMETVELIAKKDAKRGRRIRSAIARVISWSTDEAR
jgi:hypothetical protein